MANEGRRGPGKKNPRKKNRRKKKRKTKRSGVRQTHYDVFLGVLDPGQAPPKPWEVMKDNI